MPKRKSRFPTILVVNFQPPILLDSVLMTDMIKWLEENNMYYTIKECHQFRRGIGVTGIYFDSSLDHMAFKLRWT